MAMHPSDMGEETARLVQAKDLHHTTHQREVRSTEKKCLTQLYNYTQVKTASMVYAEWHSKQY